MEINRVKFFKGLLRECFATDADLLSTWHVCAGQGLEACVKKTHRDLGKANATVFEITDDGERVGYFGKEIAGRFQFLTGFFVKPQFRTKEKMREFWALVLSEFNGTFLVGLYKKNKPAIEFIEKNLGQFFCEATFDDGEAVFYKVEV